MNIQIIKNAEDFNCFVDCLNEAYKERSCSNIPYQPLTYDELAAAKHIVIAAFENNNMVGGLCLRKGKEKDITKALISHVWTHIEYKRRGIASKLLEYAEEYAISVGGELMQLNVANIYLPAINLYKKMGYLKYIIYANEPHTYYFVRMVKPIGGYSLSPIKRKITYLKSWIIFSILFKKDSTPRLTSKVFWKLRGG